MPGPLDLTSDAASEPDRTEVLSLDDLFDDGTASDAAPATADTATAPVPATAERHDPFHAGSAAAPTVSTVGRIRDDARTAWDGARTRSRTWLRTGDNALIALTVVVAVLLIVVIAAV
jgi:hypothetical protein